MPLYTYIIDHHGCWLKIHHMFSQVLCVFDGHGVDGHWPAQRITESWCPSVARVTSWGVLEMGVSPIRILSPPKNFDPTITYLGVSINWGTPKSSILKGFSLINHPAILGYPHLWNPPVGIWDGPKKSGVSIVSGSSREGVGPPS